MRKYNQYNFYFICCQYNFCWPVKVKFRNFYKLKKDKCKTSSVMGYLVKIRSFF